MAATLDEQDWATLSHDGMPAVDEIRELADQATLRNFSPVLGECAISFRYVMDVLDAPSLVDDSLALRRR